jgi:hypothetical protein
VGATARSTTLSADTSSLTKPARAARASHAPKLSADLEAWADSIDWSEEAGVHRSLREAAVLVLKRGLTPAQVQAMAKLADLRLCQLKPTKPAPPAVLVEVQRFGPPNGQEPAS